MKKRFKFRKKQSNNLLKICLVIILIYISFSFFYRIIYNIKVKNMNNEKIIKYIIDNNKNNPSDSKLLDKIKSPEFLLKYTLDIDLNNSPKEITLVNKEVDKPLVYIYNTHEKEAYTNSNAELYNIVPTVKTADYILEENLKDLGIGCIIENESVTDILKNNNWSYARSYDVSRKLVMNALNKYNDIKLVIDIHRDSLPLNKTLLEYDDKKYAKVLFVVGLEYDNYEKNRDLAKKLSNNINDIIPNLSRGIVEKSGDGVNGIYNQDLTNHSVLLEIGGPSNEINDVNNTITIVARAILKYLEGE